MPQFPRPPALDKMFRLSRSPADMQISVSPLDKNSDDSVPCVRHEHHKCSSFTSPASCLRVNVAGSDPSFDVLHIDWGEINAERHRHDLQGYVTAPYNDQVSHCDVEFCGTCPASQALDYSHGKEGPQANAQLERLKHTLREQERQAHAVRCRMYQDKNLHVLLAEQRQQD